MKQFCELYAENETGAVKKTAPVIDVNVSMIICTQDRVRYPHFAAKRFGRMLRRR